MTSTMRRRPHRRTPAIITGLLLLVACLAVVAPAIRSLLGYGAGEPITQLRRLGTGTGWDETATLVAAGVLAAVGLVLACSGLWPGRPTVLPLTATDGLAEAGITRTGLCRILARAAVEVDGVSEVTVTAGRHTVTVTVHSALRDVTGLDVQVQEPLGRQLDNIDLADHPRLRLRLRPARGDGS